MTGPSTHDEGIAGCMAILKTKSTVEERARRIAEVLEEGVGLSRDCAKYVLCHRTDRLVAVLAIEELATSYTGDPSTPWGLMDGLRLGSIDDAYADTIDCPGAHPLVDGKNGADDVNTHAVQAQLAITARDHGRVWLQDADALLFSMSEPERKKLVARLDAKMRAQAVKDIDALDAATKSKLTRLRALLAAP